MGKISNGTFRDWNNGETMFEADYEKERELLRVAINDNYDRIIKKYEVVDKAGVVKATQNLTTAINYLKFKESDNVVLTLDTTTSTLTIGVVDGSITTAKIQNLAVTTAKIADANVTTIKIADLNVTRGKIADSAVNLQKLDLVDLDTRYYTETEIDTKVNDLSGTGRTTETIKGNADALATHKGSSDHDGRYYTKTLLDGGQLDTRYYTEGEVDNKLSNTAGGESYSYRKGTAFPTSPIEGDVFYRTDLDSPYYYNGSSWEFFTDNAINRKQDRLLANHEAWFDVDSRATPNSGKYYDLFDGTNNLSIGQIDQTKTRSTTALTASATAVTITVESLTGLKVGQEVTIFDDVALERKVISAIDTTNTTITVPSLANSYKQYASVCRSNVIVDTTNKLLKFDGWGTETTNTVTDASVVADADTTNASSRPQMLSNGWLVASVATGDTVNGVAGSGVEIHLSKDNGATWAFCAYFTATGTTGETVLQSIVSKGTQTYLLCSHGGYIYFNRFDSESYTGTPIDLVSGNTTIETQSSVDSLSITINADKTELPATWSSVNGTYPNSKNIRYVKGTIASDGSVTWGTVEQVTTANTSGVDFIQPSITSNAYIVVYQNSSYKISIFHKTNNIGMHHGASNWYNANIYDGGTYAQANPSAIFVPSSIDGTTSGTIHVAWQSGDSTHASYTTIGYSYSLDLGSTWSAREKLVDNTNDSHAGPSITTNKNNVISVLWNGGYAGTGTYNNIQKKVNQNGTWGTISQITNNTTASANFPSTLFDNTFTLDFSEPLFIYQDNEGGKVGFYGTWTVSTKTPVKTVDVRYNITPSSSITEAVAWVERQIGDLTIDGAVSIVADADNESYVAMDKTSVNIDADTDEDQFVGNVATANSKATVRLTLNRTDTANDKAVEKILGAVN